MFVSKQIIVFVTLPDRLVRNFAMININQLLLKNQHKNPNVS